MRGKIESLNVSVAAGIALYEAIRNRESSIVNRES
jgi:tRNA G18 (ribose-2'-O)-methylase SpoU